MNQSLRLAALSLSAAAAVFISVSSASAGDIISIPGDRFFPEGIAIDAGGGLYVGSLTKGQIDYVAPNGDKAQPFIAAGTNGLVSVVGMQVNADGNLLYACSSDPGFGELTGTAKPALTAFKIAGGSAAGRFEIPGGGFCNDLTELPDGTILAADSFNPIIYALKPGSDKLEIWLKDERFIGEGFNLNGIAAVPGAVFVVRYNTGALHRIDVNANGDAGRVAEVHLNRPLKGADGLYALEHHKNEFLIVEGGGLSAGSRGQLSKITVNGMNGVVTDIRTDMNVPTTAAIGKGVVYVVEGQLDNLFDKTAGAPDPFQIVKVPYQ